MDDTDLMEPRREKPGGRPNPIVVGAILLAAAGGIGYFLWSSRAPAPSPPPTPVMKPMAKAEPADAGAAEEETSFEPARRRADPAALLRRSAARGSSSKLLGEWLNAPGIFRRLAAAVRLVADGRSPRSVVGFIKVPGRFSVVESWDPKARKAGRLPAGVDPADKDRIFMARESYTRYDEIGRLFSEANPEAWGRGYRRLRPHFDRVFAEVAKPGERFDEVLGRAIDRVLSVEVPERQPELVEKGATFLFADPELEALSDVEKHLIRMGPKNAAAVQAAVRRFARSAGFSSLSSLQR